MDKLLTEFLSNQRTHLSVGKERLPGIELTYFEGASLDARVNQQLSEDFIAYRYKGDSFCFVICDGVQQSSDASLAARILGKKIVEKLPDIHGNTKLLELFVQDIKFAVSEMISNSLNGLDQQDPLYGFHLRAREETGSQVKFACGVIDFSREKLDIYWAGDIRFIVYGENNKEITSWQEDSNQLWSTKLDYPIILKDFTHNLNEITRLSITSDGIREDFKYLLNNMLFLNDTRLIQRRYQEGVDDISGLDIIVDSNKKNEQLSKLNGLLINNKSLEWKPLSRAESYRVYYYSDKNDLVQTIDVEAKTKSYELQDNLESGHFLLQAISSKELSSELSDPIKFIKQIISTSTLPIPVPTFPQKPPPIPSPLPRPFPKILIIGVALILLVLVGTYMYSIKDDRSESGQVSSSTPSSQPVSTETANNLILTSLATKASETPNVTLTPTYHEIINTSTLTSIPTNTNTATATLTNTVTATSTSTATSTNTITITPFPTDDPLFQRLNDCQKNTYAATSTSLKIYQIQSGDTLYNLAIANQTTVEELRRLNCYDSNNIKAGEYILISANQ